jgi:hypothetical protein
LAFAERYHTGRDEILLAKVVAGLPFEREFWSALASEVLWFGATEIPELQTAPDTLCCLLAPERFAEGAVPRERFAPIQQAHYGTRELVFGGRFYRPEQVGHNDAADVVRLASYLASVDPRRWTAADLAPLAELADEEERAEELEYVRDWFPALLELYDRARNREEIVICEILEPAGE